MNSRIVPSTRTINPTRVDRATGRVLGQIRSEKAIIAESEIAKIAITEAVTSEALIACSNLSALQAMLSARAPLAEERLRHLADAGTLQLTNIVLRLGQRFQ
ncbi:hypothetical protein [Conexibacter sp. CPCC 206217]|uniref:hypothetical protein n=1 Tax=Conexibacter sp. CPCC 206217 TaxID=3064574 RepID=UPI0027281C0B|nr:hypothetical protein [Conexibacter sp. CPCC 206217]MDO8213473.1 hypothetical protein [Conexibacter sp. CPCC 206217]